MTKLLPRNIGLRLFLLLVSIGMIGYTGVVVLGEGWGFINVASHIIPSFTWEGQFLMDLNCYLILSSLWILWRNAYSVRSMMIALVSLILGIIFFAPYVLFLLWKEKGSLPGLLIGQNM